MDYVEEWLKREEKLLATRRKYLHFDYRIPPSKSIDKITNPDFISKWSFWPFIENEIVFPRYKKDPLTKKREIGEKKRKICYASHFDAQIYSYYNLLLTKKYEVFLENLRLTECVIAYRRIDRKCNIHFAYEIFEKIKTYKEIVALTFDIEKFFDSLDHKLLLDKWKEILEVGFLPNDQYKVYRSLTRFSSVNEKELARLFNLKLRSKVRLRRICTSREFRDKVRESKLISINTSQKGIPQGSPLSGLLSNIYMLNFDVLINKKINSLNGLYRRYSDDLVVLCPKESVEEIQKLIISAIEEECKLEINTSKADVVFFKWDDGGKIRAKDQNDHYTSLQYLGFNFNGQDILIRSSSISKYYRKMNRRIKRAVIQTKFSKLNKTRVFTRKLYELYSHLGKRNFISYAYRASNIVHSNGVKKQLSKHWSYLNKKLEELKKKEHI